MARFFIWLTGTFELVFFVFTVLTLLGSVAALISMAWVNAKEYTQIPYMICDAWDTEEFEDYVFYEAVQGLDLTNMEYGDMNGYDQESHFFLKGGVNQGWLVLYYTKDKNVGEPLTDLKIQVNSDKTPLGFEGVTMFGNSNTVNLTDKKFTGRDSKPSIYLYQKHSAAPFTSSIRTNGVYVTIGVFSLLAGAAIGILAGNKRKRRPEEAPAQS